MNIKSTIKKLQTALIQKGVIYKINTYQFFSAEQNRMITGYTERELISGEQNAEITKLQMNMQKH